MNRIKGISDPSSLAKSGLTYADLAQGIGTFKGQTGNRVGDVYALKMLEAEKALGIDRGTMGGLAGIMRYSTDKAYSSTVSGRETVKVAAPKMKWTIGGSGVGEIEKEQDRKVGGSGVGGVTEMLSIFDSAAKGNRAIMKEMVNTFQQASQNILAISGKIGMRDVASGIASIAAGTGTEGQQLGRVVAGVQGLGQSGNPVIRSMMLRSLRQSNPNASFFDLQAMMENPLEGKNIKTTQAMFDSLKKMTGGGELYKQALYSALEGKLSRTDIKEIEEGGGDFTKIAAGKESAMKTKTKDFGRDNSDIVGKLEQSSARIESFTQDMGKQLVDYIDKSFDKIIEKLKEYEVLGPEVTSSVKEGTFKALEAAHNAGMLGGMK
jgi:hypothetical protein